MGCLTPSAKLTSPQANKDGTLNADTFYRWAIDTVSQYGDLARMHDSCQSWHLKQLPEAKK